jgi:hypothetical protein
MKDTDIHFLRQDGWSLEVLNTLDSLGYELASYDVAACEAHFSVEPNLRTDHGFSLHRQENARAIRAAIFEAGAFAREKHVKDALTTLLVCGGLRLG